MSQLDSQPVESLTALFGHVLSVAVFTKHAEAVSAALHQLFDRVSPTFPGFESFWCEIIFLNRYHFVIRFKE